eukprot:GHRQ01022752.1.p1 GENE.GHRQ01022752.1~~GHRQ01022752.1.p1  ORF type:complete len:163 (-),score=42.59 GHRQ01022752.1:672-1160(-)
MPPSLDCRTCHGYGVLQVQSMQKFRRGVPEKSSVYVCKNSLMKEAVKTVPGWEVLGEQGCTGDNAWVFVHEDDIPDTVKHWHSFSDDLMKEAKAAAPKGVEPAVPTTLTAIVMDSKVLSPAEVRGSASTTAGAASYMWHSCVQCTRLAAGCTTWCLLRPQVD